MGGTAEGCAARTRLAISKGKAQTANLTIIMRRGLPISRMTNKRACKSCKKIRRYGFRLWQGILRWRLFDVVPSPASTVAWRELLITKTMYSLIPHPIDH